MAEQGEVTSLPSAPFFHSSTNLDLSFLSPLSRSPISPISPLSPLSLLSLLSLFSLLSPLYLFPTFPPHTQRILQPGYFWPEDWQSKVSRKKSAQTGIRNSNNNSLCTRLVSPLGVNCKCVHSNFSLAFTISLHCSVGFQTDLF